jgi:hypothetical protein
MSSNPTPVDSNKAKEITQMPAENTISNTIPVETTPITKKINTVICSNATPDSTDTFIKNLFKIVQGVKYDDRCPHGLPYYACMSCSH